MLGVERPVLLAPMAGAAGGRLADAVSRAGGFGIVAAGYGDPRVLEEQMPLLAARPFGIGVITWKLPDGFLDFVLAYHPDAVWLSFGNPAPHAPAIHDAGALVICQAGTLSEAEEAAAAGADVIVAQGKEAGGHGRLEVPLLDLLEQVATAVPSIPLVAAGGINDRQDYDRVVDAGADGVVVGTALCATPEALDTDRKKNKLASAGAVETVASSVYDRIQNSGWPQGYRARSLRTELTDRWTDAEDTMEPTLETIRAEYEQARVADDVDVRAVWAGEGVGKITDVVPAATVIHRFPRTNPQ